MPNLFHFPIIKDLKNLQLHKDEFKHDILAGLSHNPKLIPSKYFYDDNGSHIFNQITRHPDYYLTHCEIEILTQYKTHIAAYLNNHRINLIELGPGEGLKTQILIEEFIKNSQDFSYTPIDFSENYLLKMKDKFNRLMPTVSFNPIQSDYFSALNWLSLSNDVKNLVLFLGSSIGNYSPAETIEFLNQLWEALNDGDFILIGFDLRKDINVLLKAYNDAEGLTKEFNLNLLNRINHELDADFDLNNFFHYGTYNVYTGAMQSFIISQCSQVVTLESLQHSFFFQSFEPIHVENSYKFLISQIEDLALKTHHKVIHHFVDSKQYFVDSLWQVKKK